MKFTGRKIKTEWPIQWTETKLPWNKLLLSYYYGRPPAAGHSVLPLSFRSFFRRLISEVAWPIVTKLCTLPRVRWWPRFIKFGQKFGWPLHPEIWQPKSIIFWRNFAQLRDLIVNISGMQQYFVNWRTALQTTDTPTQANLIRCTLVYKRLGSDPSNDHT